MQRQTGWQKKHHKNGTENKFRKQQILKSHNRDKGNPKVMKDIITTTTLTITLTITITITIIKIMGILNTNPNTAKKETITIHQNIMKEKDPGRIVNGDQINTISKILVTEENIINLITSKEINITGMIIGMIIGVIIEMIKGNNIVISIMIERIHMKSKAIIQVLAIHAITTIMIPKKDLTKTAVIMIRKRDSTQIMSIDL